MANPGGSNQHCRRPLEQVFAAQRARVEHALETHSTRLRRRLLAYEAELDDDGWPGPDASPTSQGEAKVHP